MTSRGSEGRSAVDDLLNQGFFKSTRATGSASPLPSPRASPLAGQDFFDVRTPRLYDVNSTSNTATYNALPSEPLGSKPSFVSYSSPNNNIPPPVPPKIPIQQRLPTNYESNKAPATPVGQSNKKVDVRPPQPSVRRGPMPPRPTVEDEIVAIAREILPQGRKSPKPSESDPPARGTVEQYPIILEADVSAEDAATLDAQLRKEAKAEVNGKTESGVTANDSGDRRFVLVSDPHSASERDDVRHRKPRRTSTAPPPSRPLNTFGPATAQKGESSRASTAPQTGRPSKADELRRKETTREEPRREEQRRRLSPPPMPRRRSRNEDLPILQTKLAPQPPSFQRSTSAYTQQSYKPESPRPTRTPSADYSLSSARTPTSRPKTKEYFEPNPPGRSYDASSRLETPIVEKRRSGGASPSHSPSSSRPSTPGSEKRWSAGEGLAYANAKLTRPQQLATDGQRHATLNERGERGAQNRSSRTSSSSEQYYLSSDDDLDDSSDDDRPKKSHRRRRRHHHHGLHPDDRDHHHHQHRSSSKSNRTSLEVKPQYSRHASPRNSPGHSPNVSPSQLPSIDKRDPKLDRDNRRGSARQASPYSANADVRAGTLRPVNQDEKARQASVPIPQTSKPSSGLPTSTLPVPIPSRIDVHSPGETRRTPAIPQYDDDVDPLAISRTTNGNKGHPALSASQPQASGWQKPAFVPQPNDRLDRPVGSYRRYSEDIGEGKIPQLPPCPRTIAAKGYVDWLTLPRCNGFNICPQCFNAMRNTPYASHFVPAPIRSPNDAIACDFGSQPWFRIAWLLSQSQQKERLDSIYAIADVCNKELPCMGKHFAKREWFSVLDPETGAPIRNFDVCKSCKQCIEALLPNLRGVFVETTKGPAGPERMCDMRFDSKRFVHYFDALEVMGTSKPHPRRGLDTYEFVSLARRYGTMAECPGIDDVKGSNWWSITQLPDFTVCEECFEEIVRPTLLQRRAIAAMFSWREKVPGALSCQLYSDRMRDHFEKAVDENDYKHLANKARDRKAKEISFKKDREALRQAIKSGDHRAREKLLDLHRGWERWE